MRESAADVTGGDAADWVLDAADGGGGVVRKGGG